MIPTKLLYSLGLVCLLVAPTSWGASDDYGYYDTDSNLQAPNVTFYGSILATSNNLHYLGGDMEPGFNLLAGGYFNDIKVMGLRYGVEFGYQSAGQSSDSSSRALTHAELSSSYGSNAVSGTETSTSKTRFSSLSLGARLEGERFYFRFGGALYNYYTSFQKSYYVTFNNQSPLSSAKPANSQSSSSLAPYIGFGLHLHLAKHLRMTAGYDIYKAESHRLGSLSVGVQYTR